jgi:hypothetical protein
MFITWKLLLLIDLVLYFIGDGYLHLLFFRTKLKMGAPDKKFTTQVCRAVKKFLFLKGNTAKERYYDM